MIVGVPKEVKPDEYRVAMIPAGVEELTRSGHTVLIQTGAGLGSGISDDEYARNGAELVPAAADIWKRADLIVKVKEPLPEEWPHMRAGQTVFTYFHFAADEKLTKAVLATFDATISEGEPTFAVARRAVVVHVGEDAVTVAVGESSAPKVAYALAAGTVTLVLSGTTTRR